MAALTSHTQTATDQGPDYCYECSHAVSEWVQWPCPTIRVRAIREDEQAANQVLIEQLQANERARAHNRPEPNPEPPRRFTSADIDHDKVRAAMTRAATERNSA